jgi:hypothetical protein
MIFGAVFFTHLRSVPDFQADLPLRGVLERFKQSLAPHLPYFAYPWFANFSMLCTKQNKCHCVFTLA